MVAAGLTVALPTVAYACFGDGPGAARTAVAGTNLAVPHEPSLEVAARFGREHDGMCDGNYARAEAFRAGFGRRDDSRDGWSPYRSWHR